MRGSEYPLRPGGWAGQRPTYASGKAGSYDHPRCLQWRGRRQRSVSVSRGPSDGEGGRDGGRGAAGGEAGGEEVAELAPGGSRMIFLWCFFLSLLLSPLSGGMGERRLGSPTRADQFGLGQDVVM